MNAEERIRALVRKMGMNVKQFSELCGYDRPQVMYDVIKGKTRNISSAMCDRIMAGVPNLNRVWLLTGEGAMFTDEPETVATLAVTDPNSVPLVPLSAFAGPIKAYYEGGVPFSGCERIISPVPGADFALPISGDSMEPAFPDGSIAFVKRINEQAFIPWGHSLVLDTENGIFLKNVLPDNGDDRYIWAESINPKYPPMHIPKLVINGMFRVLNVLRSYTTM